MKKRTGGSQCVVSGMTHYERNKDYYKSRASKRKKEMLTRIQQYKSERSCKDCGHNFHPVCMDFDHLPGAEKSMGVAKLVSRGVSWKRILEETKKCDLVCANCHRVRTHSRQCQISVYGDATVFQTVEQDSSS